MIIILGDLFLGYKDREEIEQIEDNQYDKRILNLFEGNKKYWN